MTTYLVGKAHPHKNLDTLIGKVGTGDKVLISAGEILPVQTKGPFYLPDWGLLASDKENVAVTIPVAPGLLNPIMCANWCERAEIRDVTVNSGVGSNAFALMGDQLILRRVKQVGKGRLLTAQGVFDLLVDGFECATGWSDYLMYLGADAVKAINRKVTLKNGKLSIPAGSPVFHAWRGHDSVDVTVEDVLVETFSKLTRSLFTIKEWKNWKLTRYKALCHGNPAGGGFGPLPTDVSPNMFLDKVEIYESEFDLGNFLDLGSGVGGGGSGGIHMTGGKIKCPQAALNCRGAAHDRKPPMDCDFCGVAFEAPALVKGPSEGVKINGGTHNGKPIGN